MAEHLKQAAREMEGAPPPLRKQAGRDALPPEQRALQHLQRAEAAFRTIQVSFGGQQGEGGGSQSRAEDLADLFDLETDKLRNQYETIQRQRQQQQQADDQVDEALERLRRLAARQQQENERMRRLAQQGPQNQSGGGGGGGQRQLAEETEEAARRLERLARERGSAEKIGRASCRERV